MDKKILWANVREQAEQVGYIECEQISKYRWKVTLDQYEYTVQAPQSSDYLTVLHGALSQHLHRNQ